MDFTKQIQADKESLIDDIKKLVAINSVEAEELENMPFGEGPAKALQCFLDIAAGMGFSVENFDNYAGHVDFVAPGAEDAEETIGILGHVDIVPVGEGWICDPFAPQVIDNKLIGRGVLDDKGPMLACLHAAKILKDEGISLSKKVRFIVGANEETDERCMHHYFHTLGIKPPTVSFTPDAEFPVKNGEMGVFQYELVTDITEELSIRGGSAVNAVPDYACALLDPVFEELLDTNLIGLEAVTGCTYAMSRDGEKLLLEVRGKAAHAMIPENGINAITGLMVALHSLKTGGDLGRIANFYMHNIAFAHHAEKFGIDMKDVYAPISFNPGTVRVENGTLRFEIDSRVPISYTCTDAEEAMIRALKGTGFRLENPAKTEKIFLDPESDLISTLHKVYQDVTGDLEATPIVDQSCTYARECPNCAAFGALLPGQENTMHCKNEALDLEALDTWMQIYLEAIYRLAK